MKTCHGRFVLLGLFDGHGGPQAAQFCKAHTLEIAARLPRDFAFAFVLVCVSPLTIITLSAGRYTMRGPPQYL